MADLMDNASSSLQQVGSQATSAGVRATVKVAMGTTRVSVRMVGGAVRALVALLDAARQASQSRSDEGKLRLRQFTRVTDGKREVVPIKDAEVARQLTRELRRHNVTFAIERNTDGSRTFHVQGKDATLIEHALTVASIRVDERITRALERSDAGRNAEIGSPTPESEPGTRVLKINEAQKATLVEALRESGQGQEKIEADKLAEQVGRDGEITLTEQNVDTLDSALSERQDLPEGLADIAAVVDEEKVAIAVDGAEVEEITVDPNRASETPMRGEADATVALDLNDQERDTLVSQMQNTPEKERRASVAPAGREELASRAQFVEKIEVTSQIELTPHNVQQLREVFAENSWTPGADGDQTPEHMRWIVDAVSNEHQSLKEHTAGPRTPVQEAPPKSQPRDTRPRLVEHGSAPYQNKEGAKPSYFVTLDQGGVRQTVWGVDLERAVGVSGAQVGDRIKLENIGSMPVTLPDGTEAHRNTWNVTRDAAAPQQQETSLAQSAPAVERSAHSANELVARVESDRTVTLPEKQADSNDQALNRGQQLSERMADAATTDLQEAPTRVVEKDAGDVAREEQATDATHSPESREAAVAKPEPQRPRGGAAARERREVTRERVARRIEVKVDRMKGQGGGAAAPTPQRAQADVPRLPTSRR